MNPRAITFSEPFHGTVWLAVSPVPGTPSISIAISLEQSWDTELLIDRGQAADLANAVGGSQLQVFTGTTVDGAPAAVLSEGGRLAIVILSDRISDVLTLGEHSHVISERLRAASIEGA